MVTDAGNDAVSEAGSTDAESDAASDPDDPTIAWCPPIPDAAEDPTELEIASAADQLAILISKTRPPDEGVHEMTAMSWKLGEGSTERSFTKAYIVEVPWSLFL